MKKFLALENWEWRPRPAPLSHTWFQFISSDLSDYVSDDKHEFTRHAIRRVFSDRPGHALQGLVEQAGAGTPFPLLWAAGALF